jgi:hypothetical protein
VGDAGIASTARRSDQTSAAFRSDMPLGAAWFIDPVNGSDASTNPGTTSATALKTIGELRKRWWSAEISQNTTVTVMGDVPPSDSWHFNTRIGLGSLVTFVGTLGPVTGFGGVSIDNTLFTGSITTMTYASATPAADDIELADTSIPVSFTASGLLAPGVIFRRTVTALRHWWASKDEGSKTIRTTMPMNNTGAGNFSAAALPSPLVNGNAYSAFGLWKMPPQTFGFMDTERVKFDSFRLIESNPVGFLGGGARGYAPQRFRCWLDTMTSPFFSIGEQDTNCMHATATATSVISFATPSPPQIIGGGFLGTGATAYDFFGVGGVGGAVVFQGCQMQGIDTAYLTLEAAVAIHDTTTPGLQTVGNGRISILNVGISGKGNTSKLYNGANGGILHYGNAFSQPLTLPPFVAGSTTDAAPIQINGVSYTVAQLPAVNETILRAFNIAGPGGPLVVIAKFTGVLTTDAVNPTANYMADPGSAIASAALGPQSYPTSGRLMTRLRATWNTGAIPTVTPVTVTLFKNGVATLMQVSIPQNTAQGTKFVDSAHAVLFVDGDDFDVRLDNAGGVNGTAIVTAVLEGPS